MKSGEVKKLVFADTSTITDNQNGYRNDGGMYLYDTYKFEGSYCTHHHEYEYMRGYKVERESILTMENALKQLEHLKDYMEASNDYYLYSVE